MIKAIKVTGDEVLTFTLAATSEQVQAAIDAAAADGLGLTVLVPWQTALKVMPQGGDGAVIEVADPADHSAWLGEVGDVEGNGPGGDPDGYDVEVTLDLM